MNCPYKWANSIAEEDDQTSSWESELEGENAEELASLETHDEEGEWWWPDKAESPDGEGELTRDRQFTISQRKAKTNRYRGD